MSESLRFYDADGSCRARDNLVIAFFGKCPFADMVEGTQYCLDQFLKIIPKDALQWSVIGASAEIYKPLTEKSIARCRSMLAVNTAKQKDVHFRLLGPEIFGPDYGFIVNGNKTPSNEGFLNQTNVIEMRFPREFLYEFGEDAVEAMLINFFKHLPCDSGYASISLCFGQESRLGKTGAILVPLALRHHGLDLPKNLSTQAFLGNRCRGARWLTLFSNQLIDELGGIESLETRLLDGVTITKMAHGALIRAGFSPEIGDINRNKTTPLLASVAHAIEAVTYFGDPSLHSMFGHDKVKQERWERRFWPIYTGD